MYGNHLVVQWGSELRTSPVFKWLKPVRWLNGLLFRKHLNTGKKLSAIQMASEYRTAIQITDIWLPDKKLSAIQMVTLFECLVFGSPLYKENVYKLGEHTITLHP